MTYKNYDMMMEDDPQVMEDDVHPYKVTSNYSDYLNI